MPFVRITMMPREEEVKKALAKEITHTIRKHCKVSPDQIWILFEEAAKTSWSFGGKLASD